MTAAGRRSRPACGRAGRRVEPEGGPPCTVRSAATRTRGSSTRGPPTTASSIRRRRQCPAVQPPLHHGRDREPVGRQALRRHRAVQPREDRQRRAQGVPGAPGERGRPRAARAEGRGDAAQRRVSAEIDAYEIGLAILGPLRELDEVAYLRFASVYQAFDSLEDFEAAITVLRAERDSERTTTPTRPSDADPSDETVGPAERGRPHHLSGTLSAGPRRFDGCFLRISSSSMSPVRPPSCPTAPAPSSRSLRPDLDGRRVRRPPLVGRPRRRRPAAASADPRAPRHVAGRQPGRSVDRVPARRARGQAAGARGRGRRAASRSRLTDAPLGASEPRFSPDGTQDRLPGARARGGSVRRRTASPAAEDPRHITELKYRARRDRVRPRPAPARVRASTCPPTASGRRPLPDAGRADRRRRRRRRRCGGCRPATRWSASRRGTRPGDRPAQRRGAHRRRRRSATRSPPRAAHRRRTRAARSASTRCCRRRTADRCGSWRATSGRPAGLRRRADRGCTGCATRRRPGAAPERLTDPETGPASAASWRSSTGDAARRSSSGAAPCTWCGSPRTATQTTLVGGTARGLAARRVAAGERTRRRHRGDARRRPARCFRVDVATASSRRCTDLCAPLRATGRVRVAASSSHATAPDGYAGARLGGDAGREPLRRGPAPDDPDDPRRPVRAVHARAVRRGAGAGGGRLRGRARQPARVVGVRRGRTAWRSAGGFGTVDTDDVLALLGAALEDPALDGERVGVMGGSYGGYLTAWLTTRTRPVRGGDRRARLPRPGQLRRVQRHRLVLRSGVPGRRGRRARARRRWRRSRRWRTSAGSARRRWSSTRSRTGGARSSRASAGSSS